MTLIDRGLHVNAEPSSEPVSQEEARRFLYGVPARVISEPFTYRRDDSTVSYIADRYRAAKGNQVSKARLQRHAQEMDGYRAEKLRHAPKAPERLSDGQEIEYRVNPSVITGQGGEFAPPAWVIEDFATYPRAGRILSRLIPNFPLPKGVQSINLPRMTAGNIAQWQGNDNSTDPSADVTTATVSSEVATISGMGDISLQLLEQSPVGAYSDWAWFKDLTSAYDYSLELQLLTGTGSPTAITGQSQLPGILNLPTGTGQQYVNTVTYTDGSPTGHAMYPYVGQLAAAVGINRHLPPEAWLLSTARWAWFRTSEDLQDLPFDFPDLNGTDNALCPGAFMGWPVWVDDAIPRTLGTTGNWDTIIACRPSDMLIFEADPVQSTFVEVLSGTLGARIQFRNYVAAITSRYPSGISWMSGSGCIPVSGF